MRPSRLVPLALLALLAAGAAWLWAEAPHGDGEEGEYPVLVRGPGGEALFDGTVHDADGTPFSALVAASEAGGFEVAWTGSSGRLSCSGLYVSSIAGHEAQDAAGWEYWVRHEDGSWELPDASSACFALASGDGVAWAWTESPSDGSRPPQW